ncbi:MAG: hypothetical protein IPP41_11620 [Rhodocyclaceae bacterium]|nr:hypothetical protein [Rhodocyclaceae bacterium]
MSAVKHVTDLPRLVALRKGLRERVARSPLFDAPRFARHFEHALRAMWGEWSTQSTAAEFIADSEQTAVDGSPVSGSQTPEPIVEISTPAATIEQDIAASLATALALHQQGKFAEAELGYNSILKAQPLNFEAKQLLGTIALQRRNFELALALFDQAIQISITNCRLYGDPCSRTGNEFKKSTKSCTAGRNSTSPITGRHGDAGIHSAWC